ncbi:MAG TPA: glycine cleavage system protein GcvH [Armatimonadota bacterium]|nr:glycine cleavage system protein GcvH [Armatimonadota bacterium]
MNLPSDLKYARTHEWARVEGDEATIGITDFAQHELGDVVYLDLPKVGQSFRAGAPFGTIESVKAVSDLYAPLSGEVVEVNEALLDAPEGVNTSPYESGWLLKLKLSDPSEVNNLLDAAAYEASAGSH